MIKTMLLHLSHSDRAKRIITSWPFVRPMVRRFVAGERLEDAIAVAKDLDQRGLTAALNHLGEHVHTSEDARRALEEYLRLAKAIRESNVQAYISVKPTQLGLDLDEELCQRELEALLQAAKEYELFVRIDMESSEYVERTLRLFESLYPRFPNLGLVIQSYLRRSARDLERLIQLGAPVRLVKGAYLESVEVAFRNKREVDYEYVKLLEGLLSAEARKRGVHTAIATHDEKIIRWACRFIRSQQIRPYEYEFQLLLGVRQDLQHQLMTEGHPVRLYVSYGEEWFPYFMRRLAERPANVAFFLKHLVVRSLLG